MKRTLQKIFGYILLIPVILGILPALGSFLLLTIIGFTNNPPGYYPLSEDLMMRLAGAIPVLIIFPLAQMAISLIKNEFNKKYRISIGILCLLFVAFVVYANTTK